MAVDGNLLWRRFLSVAYADLIVATTFFSISAIFLLMWLTILVSAGLWGAGWFWFFVAFWCGLAGPYTYLMLVIVREAWKLPKELWRATAQDVRNPPGHVQEAVDHGSPR